MVLKNIGIQYLRAICALVVYFSHFFKGVNDSKIIAFYHSRWSFLVDGSIAVIIFFVISDFFYYKTTSLNVQLYWRGLLKKIIRIYPVHIFMLVVGLICCNIHNNWNESYFTDWGNSFWNMAITWKDFLYQATCILYFQAVNIINPSAWYLKYEVILFLLMPLIVSLINKIRWKYSWIFLLLVLTSDFSSYNLLSVLSICYIGVLTRQLVEQRNFNFFKNSLLLLLWLAVGIFFLAHFYLGIGKNYMFLQAVGGAMVVVLFYIIKFPFIKSLYFWGNISFEFYIVQHIVLLAFRPLFINPLIYFLLTLSFTIIVSYFLNVFFKKVRL